MQDKWMLLWKKNQTFEMTDLADGNTNDHQKATNVSIVIQIWDIR